MRISDWSSDVCSSDLRRGQALPELGRRGHVQGNPFAVRTLHHIGLRDAGPAERTHDLIGGKQVLEGVEVEVRHGRSEEHTSELQSLMRISYAVFCLKKKKEQTLTQKTKFVETNL